MSACRRTSNTVLAPSRSARGDSLALLLLPCPPPAYPALQSSCQSRTPLPTLHADKLSSIEGGSQTAEYHVSHVPASCDNRSPQAVSTWADQIGSRQAESCSTADMHGAFWPPGRHPPRFAVHRDRYRKRHRCMCIGRVFVCWRWLRSGCPLRYKSAAKVSSHGAAL